MSYDYDDGYDYERDYRRSSRPQAHRYRTDQRRSGNFLDPNMNSSGLHRTRSVGAQPAPNVYIYNDNMLDSNMSQRSSSRSPPGPIYPPSPRFRGRDDELAEGVLALALDNQRMGRSRSRGRSDFGVWDGRGDYYERQLRDLERQGAIDRERERIKNEYEIQKLRDEAKREHDEQREKDERKRIIAEYEQKLRDEEDDRKAEEERIRAKIEKDKQDAKEKHDREYEAFLAEQEKKKREEKEKKEKEEEHLQEEMRKRLRRFGYTETQIEIMIKEESDKKAATTSTTTTITRWGGERNPVYPKIHVKYLSVDTLRYYELPWEYDSFDSNYIIIKREMDKYETEVLFEHTRKLRAGGGKVLLLEPKKEEKQYAFYRKRDRSRSRIRKVGILEL